MKIITFANHKGGVGKTTSGVNVATTLAQLGFRVLALDCDPQCNLSISFKEAQLTPNIGQLIDGTPLSGLRQIVGENLHLVASTKRLEYLDKVLGQSPTYQFLLRDALATVAGDYDYCIIDTRPALSAITYSALTASDAIFIPAQPEFYGHEGLQTLLEAIDLVRQHFNPSLRVGGIFFTRYAPTYRLNLHHQLVNALRQDPVTGPMVMSTTIRQTGALAEAQTLHQSIYEWAPESNGAIDYTNLTHEIISRL